MIRSRNIIRTNWWTRVRVDNGLRRYARDYFAGDEMNLPQTFYAYRYSIPESERRRARTFRLYPPFEVVLRYFKTLLEAWQSLDFAVFFFPAKTKAAEITGWRFGWLVAVEYSHSAPGSGRIWKCLCRCGKTSLAAVKNLIRGRVVSCGCYRRTVGAKLMGRRMIKNIAGRKFGRITAVSITGNKYGSESVWSCRCDCGGEVDLPVSSLTSRGVRSCGCLRDEAGTKNLELYRKNKGAKKYDL